MGKNRFGGFVAQTMLICDDIAACFDQKIIFKNLGFCLNPGSLLRVIGKNGSGKTSLLKIIAGLNSPDLGKIYYKKQDISICSEDYFKDLNYIGHKNSLNKESSVLDNLSFLANIRGNKELLVASIVYFGLNNIVDLKVSKLSAGWMRRACLARLVYCPAKIWLLDEPEANLDIEGKILLSNLIKTRIAQNGIVIISTHNSDWLSGDIQQINMEDYGC
jgi:heme exporter protein A